MPGLPPIAVSGSYCLVVVHGFPLQSLLLLCLQALGTLEFMGSVFVVKDLVGIFPDQGLNPAIARILNYWTTKEAYDLLLRFITFIYLDILTWSSYLTSNPTNIRIRLGGSRWTQKIGTIFATVTHRI